ncbi:MAG: hemolysin family protein [Eubacteriales bacterium]|nr:hemolysin family protein [Eubacteriales bacterium]
MDTQPLVQIVLLIILLLGSGFFSSAETAFTTVNRIQVQLLADEKNRNAERVLWILDHSPKMLSAILIGNNLVNISASALATTLTIHFFGNVYVGAATGILTLLVLVFGEITPKSLASLYSLQMALAYSGVIVFLMKMLTPVIFVIEGIRTGLLKLLGIDPNAKLNAMTEDELKTLVDVGLEDGAIEDDEFEMITNVFRLDESLAKDIMVPRIDMTFIPVDATREELMEIYREEKYTRYPVYSEDRDQVIGTINMKDLLMYPENEPFNIRKILRTPHFTFEHKEVGTLLIEMRKASISLIIVLDEYGATSGMITLEDILEEIVGEIRDEFDKDERDAIIELEKGKEYLIDGSTNLDDVNQELSLELTSVEYDTLGGYLIELLDRLPKKGETILLENGIRIVVEIVRRNRIEKIHVFLPEETSEKEEKSKHS